jgi:serine/threonine-protein kinase RsbW
MKVKFEADLKNLPKMIAFLRSQSQSFGFEAYDLHNIELACEEALVNIIKHGFPKRRGHIILHSQASSSKAGIEIVISDDGIPFNPLEYIKHTPSKIKEESQQLGGYGIYLIVNLMDKVDYKRMDNLNTLILVKWKVL